MTPKDETCTKLDCINPNPETIAAIAQARAGEMKTIGSVTNLMQELEEDQTEEQIQEHLEHRRLAVNLSIQSHGGPFLGCEECGVFEQETLDPANQKELAGWLQHLTME